MTKILRLYDKDNKVLKESEDIQGSIGSIKIENLEQDTTYFTGDFKVVWVVEGKESLKVDIPEFKTLSSSNDKIIIVSYNVESTQDNSVTTVNANDIEGLNDSIESFFYNNIYSEMTQTINDQVDARIKNNSQNNSLSTSILKDKKGLFIGDSITEVNFRSNKNYHQFIADRTGLININMGVSGTGYQDRKNVAYDVTEQPDFISVMLGTNDYGLVASNIKPLGNASDHKYDTVAGSIYYTFLQLSKNFPTTPIVVMTPLPRIESNPFKEQQNKKGYSLGDLVKVIKELANKFSFPVLDLYNNSNLRVWDTNVNNEFFQVENKELPADGLHPNVKGHEWISYMIQSFLEDKAIVGNLIPKNTTNNLNTNEQDLGNGLFSKIIRPKGIFHKEDTSFIVNIDKNDIDLKDRKVLRIEYNNKYINDPNDALDNSPYWYTLPNYDDGSQYNKTSDVNNFKEGLELIDDGEKGLEFLRDYMVVYYTSKNSTLKGSDIKISTDNVTPTVEEPQEEVIEPIDNGDGTFSVTLTPTNLSWNPNQSLMVNIDENKFSLKDKKVQSISYNNNNISKPLETQSSYFYWLTVPQNDQGIKFEDGSDNNRTSDVTNFVSNLQQSSVSSDGRIVYKQIPITITYK
ncbi:lipase acylhydrolase domain protein [Staphylococcus phage CF5]|uniref:Lipase acylhydrolase domain protein n=1 Tax=Staphylococcus phage CF5 TaxID=3113739 RepID=A0AAX4J761_9CAUD|nr:lipase acylhydrolase domain protein [Staphylococcus phage CF5]